MFQSEICDLNGILNRKKFNNNFWLIKVRNYWQNNQFEPVQTSWCTLVRTDWFEKSHGLTKTQFSSIPHIINIQY